MSESKYAVIGLGQFGTAIARTLTERGSQVLAIDIDPKKTEYIKDQVAYAVNIDCTNLRSLEDQNISEMEAVVVAIGKNFEALLLTCVFLLEMNVKRIIARANGAQQRTILEKMGVKEILSPEDEVGISVAKRLMNPSILSSLQLRDDFEIVEVKAPARILGRALEEIDLRQRFGLTIVTIKREFEVGEKENGDIKYTHKILGVPSPSTLIQKEDALIVFGLSKDIKKFTDLN